MSNLSTENELISLLSENNPMTILDISNELRLTKADIRYQIKKLLLEKIVIEVIPDKGLPGRPAKRYTINPNYYPDNFDSLLHAFYTLVSDKSKLIDELSNHFANLVQKNEDNSTLQNINSLVSFFSRMKYDSRWETQYQGPTLYFKNCPYRKIINSFPELCEMDRLIITKFLNLNVVTQKTIFKESRNCQFLILLKKPSAKK